MLILFVTACGEDREDSVQEGTTGTTSTGTTGTSTTPAEPSRSPVATVEVRETEFELNPANPKLPKAGLVEFEVVNAGNVPHALEVEGPSGEVETEVIEPGRKATLKADLSRPGSYVWYCPVADHEQRGMKGSITVAGAAKGRDRSGGDHRGGDDDTGGGVNPDGHGGY